MAAFGPTIVTNLPNEPTNICAEFWADESCTSDHCPYLHYSSCDIKIIETHREEGYFTVLPENHSLRAAIRARYSPSKPCRFFLRGYCNKAENCHFSHEVANEIPSGRLTRTISDSGASDSRRSSTRSTSKHRGQRNGTSPLPSTSKNVKTSISPSPKNNENVQQTSSKDEAEPADENMVQQEGDTQTGGDESTISSPPATADVAIVSVFSQWLDAPEFVPSRPKSYAQALGPTHPNDESTLAALSEQRLCPYTTKDGFCRYPQGECAHLHGDLCDMCGRQVLHPYNENERKKHHQECIKQHEKDMELSFALARSKEKSCGVCFEIVMEKEVGEQRFGILPNCNHCFCLSCIRKWRQARQFENKIIRACPECRITSDFVCPSMYWVDTKEDKDKLIDDYKNALARKDCKYFKKGNGKCPFGNKCFYLHAFPDGRKCDVGPPPRRRHRAFDNTDIDVLQQVILWDFLDDRDSRWDTLADELEDLAGFFSDSDDSDWSDYEFFLD